VADRRSRDHASGRVVQMCTRLMEKINNLKARKKKHGSRQTASATATTSHELTNRETGRDTLLKKHGSKPTASATATTSKELTNRETGRDTLLKKHRSHSKPTASATAMPSPLLGDGIASDAMPRKWRK